MSDVVRVAGYSRVETPCQSNPNLFFSDADRGRQEAKKICGTCPVRARCFDQAREDGEKFGVWGGVDFSKEEVKNPDKCQKGIHRLPKVRDNNKCKKCAQEYKKEYNSKPEIARARKESNRQRSRDKKNALGQPCRSGQHILTNVNSERRSDGALMCLECVQSPRIRRFRNDKGVRDGHGFSHSK
jgi:hypothetical protein